MATGSVAEVDSRGWRAGRRARRHAARALQSRRQDLRDARRLHARSGDPGGRLRRRREDRMPPPSGAVRHPHRQGALRAAHRGHPDLCGKGRGRRRPRRHSAARRGGGRGRPPGCGAGRGDRTGRPVRSGNRRGTDAIRAGGGKRRRHGGRRHERKSPALDHHALRLAEGGPAPDSGLGLHRPDNLRARDREDLPRANVELRRARMRIAQTR
jgi:hypothetical protein